MLVSKCHLDSHPGRNTSVCDHIAGRQMCIHIQSIPITSLHDCCFVITFSDISAMLHQIALLFGGAHM